MHALRGNLWLVGDGCVHRGLWEYLETRAGDMNVPHRTRIQHAAASAVHETSDPFFNLV